MKHTMTVKEAASLVTDILAKELGVNPFTHDIEYHFHGSNFPDGELDPNESSITIEFKEKK